MTELNLSEYKQIKGFLEIEPFLYTNFRPSGRVHFKFFNEDVLEKIKTTRKTFAVHYAVKHITNIYFNRTWKMFVGEVHAAKVLDRVLVAEDVMEIIDFCRETYGTD